MEIETLIPTGSEARLIGALIQEWLVINQCRNRVHPDSFGNLLYGVTYKVMLALSGGTKRGFDFSSVMNALRGVDEFKGHSESDLMSFLADTLIDSAPSLAHLYIDNICDFHRRRTLVQAAERVNAAAHDTMQPIDDVVSKSQSAILSITVANDDQDDDYSDEIEAELMRNFDTPAAMRGLRTGMPMLDGLVAGFGGGEDPCFAIFFGHSHVGKSLITQQIVMGLLNPKINDLGGRKIAVAPTEMGIKGWKKRLIAFKFGISTRAMKTGQFDKYAQNNVLIPRDILRRLYQEAIQYVNKLPIKWIYPKMRMANGQDIINHAMTGMYAAIIVDGIKDLGFNPDKPSNQDSDYARTKYNAECLHFASHNLRTPVFATHQMKTMYKGREDKRPQPEDLFGGKDPFEKSNFAAALYRDAQHKFTNGANDEHISAKEKRKTFLYIHKDRIAGSEKSMIELEMQRGDGMGFKEIEVTRD